MSVALSRRGFVASTLGALVLIATRSGVSAQTPIASPVASFPRTVTHEMGETTIPAQPTRVVAVSDFIDLDYLLALDVAPVLYGFTNAWESGSMPWQTAATDLPSFDASVETDLEAIAAANPDLIVAMPSEQAVYDLLSQIAPTIVLAWDTAWRDGLTLVGTALGLDQVAAERIAEGDGQISAVKDTLAPISDKTLMVGFLYSDAFYIWGEETAAGRLFLELGLNFVGGGDPYLLEASLEQVNLLSNADILLSVNSDPEGIAKQEASPLFRTLPAVQNGGYDVLTVLQSRAMTDLSPLSMPWIFPQFTELMQKLANGEGKKLA